MSHKIPILMYHNIDYPPKQAGMTGLYVHPGSFARQMAFLHYCGYRGVSLRELEPYLSGEKQGKVVGITFDDGYLDTLTNALPTLIKYDFTATCYIVADRIGQYNSWDAALLRVKKPLMDRAQIQQWLSAGMEVGCHSLTHAHLPQCNSLQLVAESLTAKQKLEDEFTVDIRHFCYPYGEYDANVRQHVIDSGFKSAVTTCRSRVTVGDNDLWQLPRILVSRSTMLHLFFLKLHTRYEDRRATQALTA